jgi:hypothetical protein
MLTARGVSQYGMSQSINSRTLTYKYSNIASTSTTFSTIIRLAEMETPFVNFARNDVIVPT